MVHKTAVEGAEGHYNNDSILSSTGDVGSWGGSHNRRWRRKGRRLQRQQTRCSLQALSGTWLRIIFWKTSQGWTCRRQRSIQGTRILEPCLCPRAPISMGLPVQDELGTKNSILWNIWLLIEDPHVVLEELFRLFLLCFSKSQSVRKG